MTNKGLSSQGCDLGSTTRWDAISVGLFLSTGLRQRIVTFRCKHRPLEPQVVGLLPAWSVDVRCLGFNHDWSTNHDWPSFGLRTNANMLSVFIWTLTAHLHAPSGARPTPHSLGVGRTSSHQTGTPLRRPCTCGTRNAEGSVPVERGMRIVTLITVYLSRIDMLVVSQRAWQLKTHGSK